MRKWILLVILTIGMIFLLAGCSGCNLTKNPISNAINNLSPNTTETITTETIAPGDCIATNTDGAETIAIAGATFKMGSLATDPGAKTNEQPQHDVTLSCYNIYKKEVTNAMFNKCVADGACVPVQVRENNPTRHTNDAAFADYPVVGADYNMATEYCTWAGARLPTEAEWEYAARGQVAPTYPWGNNDPACTLADSKGCLTPEDTQKVGSLTAGESIFTLDDMAGNAWEWVFDWYSADYYGKSSTTDPSGPIAGFWKIVRGGGYNSVNAMLRSANRHAGDPYKPYYNVGFRCVTAPLLLPDGYSGPNPNTHEVALDGPVDDDDPGDPGTPVGWNLGHVNCPDGNGNIHFSLSLLPHPFATLTSFTVDGNDFTCTWDDGSQLYQCVGPNSATADPNYSVSFCMHTESGDDGCVLGMQVPKPVNCDQGEFPQRLIYSLGCPENGFVKVTFHSEPVVTWTTAEVDGGIAMNCITNAAQDLVCLAKDAPPGGPYLFHLKGTDVNNVPYEAWIDADPNPNCPQGTKDFKGFLELYCDVNGPAVNMMYSTSLVGNPILKLDGFDITLTPNGPNSATGPVDPSLQGMTVPYAMGIDPDMLAFGTVVVPQCQKPTTGDFFLGSRCDPQIGPMLTIQYVPPSQTVASLSINGVDTPWTPDVPGGNTMTYKLPPALWGTLVSVKMCLGDTSNCLVHEIMGAESCTGVTWFARARCDKETPVLDLVIASGSQVLQGMKIDGTDYDITKCTNLGPGHYQCPLPNTSQGTTITVDVEVDDIWSSGSYPVPVCTQQTSCICRITAPDCLTATSIGFNIDTCVNNPAELAPQTVTANDGTNTFNCVLTGALGQIYCGGSLPETSGPLSVCFLQQGSQTQQCCYFPNFGSSIPDCDFVPPEGEPNLPPCSSYTSSNTCPSNRCKWVIGPTGGGGSCQ